VSAASRAVRAAWLAAMAGTAVCVATCLAGCGASSGSGGGGPPPPDCTTLVAPSACPSPAPSWKGEVQGLFHTYCQQCHGTGGVAYGVVPMQTYADVSNNRTRIWEATYNCSMPGGQDAGVAPMAYPTIAERQTMIEWADVCNAPNN
jgi:hypothetical protein